MKPDEILVKRVAQEVRSELESLDTLTGEFRRAPRERGDSYALRARASILHDFYTGIERIFVRIAEELNGGIPRGEHRHRQLLTDMTLELAGIRPRVISRKMAELLGPFLRFRHLFRNLYGFILDGDRISEVESGFEDACSAFATEMNVFLGWLTGE